MSECRYIPLEQRAAELIQKGVRTWQEIQRIAMAEDELLDAVALLGQELWLPHHETDASKYHTTLRVAVHLPAENRAAFTEVEALFRELERRATNEQGGVRIAAEFR